MVKKVKRVDSCCWFFEYRCVGIRVVDRNGGRGLKLPVSCYACASHAKLGLVASVPRQRRLKYPSAGGAADVFRVHWFIVGSAHDTPRLFYLV